MTAPLSMSMFASKEDLQAARISQLEADNAALMEVVRAAHTVDMEAFVDRLLWIVPDAAYDGLSNALDALPAHLKEAAKEA
ncbi:hypothetical protein ACHMW5_13900 [Azospirillum melinis]|uniref:hypothetical protein n=1 Tax=Azospirillum melinis TaxID=328839 RepID=UPI0037573776